MEKEYNVSVIPLLRLQFSNATVSLEIREQIRSTGLFVPADPILR